MTPQLVNIDEMNAITKRLDSYNYINVTNERDYKYKKRAKKYHKFYIISEENYFELRFLDPEDKYQEKYYKLYTNEYYQTEFKISGYEAYKRLNDYYRTIKHQKGSNIKEDFGYSPDNKKIREEIKKCVPIQIQYINKKCIGKIKTNCCKADISSAFPYQMATKMLPTLTKCQIVKETVEPNPTYPFAFYPEAKTLRIFGEENFDIVDIFGYTILCKAVDKNIEECLSQVFTDFYQSRNAIPENKQAMNATIGYFQFNKNPYLPHLAAVTIYRNNNRMQKYMQILKSEGSTILYVATDSIVWQGSPSPIVSKEKEFGAFVSEGENGKFYGLQVGAYQFETTDKLITKCFYIKDADYKNSLKLGELPQCGLKPMIRYNEKKAEFEVI